MVQKISESSFNIYQTKNGGNNNNKILFNNVPKNIQRAFIRVAEKNASFRISKYCSTLDAFGFDCIIVLSRLFQAILTIAQNIFLYFHTKLMKKSVMKYLIDTLMCICDQ